MKKQEQDFVNQEVPLRDVQAIMNYCQHNVYENPNLPDLRSKARRHLLAVGWNFRIGMKCKGRRKELRYISPSTKTYYSLIQACEGYLKENDIPLSQPQLNLAEISSTERNQEEPHKEDSLEKCTRKEDDAFQKRQWKFKFLWKLSTLQKPKDMRIQKTKFYENNLLCTVCHEPGMDSGVDFLIGIGLAMCHQCPSSFHLKCINLGNFPGEYWLCPSCRCGICRDEENLNDEKVLYCGQCEKPFHCKCLVNLDSYVGERWFCSRLCKHIYITLHGLLGKSIEVGEGDLSLSIFKYQDDGLDVVETKKRLSIAHAAIYHCFGHIKDETTQDLVKDILFNKSEKKRPDFGGFFTVFLEGDNDLKAVATLRVHGRVAEIQLVATPTGILYHHQQEMSMTIIEMLSEKLCEIGVEMLVLSATPRIVYSWAGSVGFMEMSKKERLGFLKYSFLEFAETKLCLKSLQVEKKKNPSNS